jgi:hypothetical protein
VLHECAPCRKDGHSMYLLRFRFATVQDMKKTPQPVDIPHSQGVILFTVMIIG